MRILQHGIESCPAQIKTQWLLAPDGQFSQDPKTLRISFEATVILHDFIQFLLGYVPERRVTQVMRQARSLHNVGVQLHRLGPLCVLGGELLRHSATNLTHL